METERLNLRRWEETDAEQLYCWACDPDVGPIAGWPPHQSAEESRNVIRNVLNGPEAYAVCLRPEGTVIGAVELKLRGHTDFSDREDECEIGYWIAKPYWGQGYMTEAAEAILRHAFETLGMRKVWAGYYDGNDRSRRVQEKCGFNYQWTTKDVEVPLMHETRIGHVNALTRAEWLRNHAGMDEVKQRYDAWKFRCSAYDMALSIILVDRMTVAPEAGADYRDSRQAYLEGEAFSIRTDPKILPVLEVLSSQDNADADLRKEAKLYRRDLEKLLVIPKEQYVEFQKDANASYTAWLKAKNESNYSLFEPHLKKMIRWKTEFCACRGRSDSVYDQLLDDNEPGMNMAGYDRFFARVKERVLPLIRKVTEAGQIDSSVLFQKYPVHTQKKWVEEVLLKVLGFDPSWGYQNETEHPFTSSICQNDCRTTTKYLEDNPMSAVFSTIHETGHAWYEHNTDPRYEGGILANGMSNGMHESQSRFCENYLGRSASFWTYLYPMLQEVFPGQLKNCSLNEFVRAVNVSVPSPVRTEADELTYPVHILIRYELEKGLFSGALSTEGLNRVWNEKYREYLGIDIRNDAEGILQDVHWSDGSFGYFPTYALGSAYAAQFYQAMKQDMDVDRALAEGRYTDCMNWLKEHVQKYGARYDANEIIRMATGKEFDPELYFDYLEEKYTALYQL